VYRVLALLRRPKVMAMAGAPLVIAVAIWQAAGDYRPGITRAMVHALESRFERTDVDDWGRISGLVVLGGTTQRVHEALRLAAVHPHLRLVFSGPGEEELAIVRRAQNVDATRISVENVSINTFGNAYYSKAHIRPQAGERWLLVTCASHMPRAIGGFYRVGFNVEPWPVARTSNADALLKHIAQHEWLGLLAYWARGRTIAIFPGQDDISRRTPHLARDRSPATAG